MNKKERLAIEKASSPIESLIAKMLVAKRKMVYTNDKLYWDNKPRSTLRSYRNVRLQFYIFESKVQTLPVLTCEEDVILCQHIPNPTDHSIHKSDMDSSIRKLLLTMMIHETRNL